VPIFNHVSVNLVPMGQGNPQNPGQPVPIMPMLNPVQLMNDGPFMPVVVSVPSVLATAIAAQGQPVPAPVAGIALIDTGATRTCVDTRVIQSLGIQQISAVSVHTANGPTLVGTYPAKFLFPTFSGLEIEFSSVLSATLSGQLIQNQPLIVLIGRDFLMSGILNYHGTTGSFSLAL
jgi:Aspartyl protease